MPSLTLTDPDMILPYDGSERESQTPSPPSQLVYLSNLNARYSGDAHGASAASTRPKKNFSRHWSHDDVNANRRLSDIGEELSPSRLEGFEESEGSRVQGLASSPVIKEPLTASETKDEVESSSSSTVSVGSSRSLSSMQKPSPQIAVDQAPNPAEGVNKPENEAAIAAGLPDSTAIISATKGKGPGDEFSSAILSSEAERILENAKKRLTVGGEFGLNDSGQMLSWFTVDGGQPEPRSFGLATHTLALTIITGELTYWVSSAGWSLSVDFPPQGSCAPATIAASVTRCFDQPALACAQRDQPPIRVHVERYKANLSIRQCYGL